MRHFISKDANDSSQIATVTMISVHVWIIYGIILNCPIPQVQGSENASTVPTESATGLPTVTNEPEPATSIEPTAEATNEPEPTSAPEGEPSVEPESETTTISEPEVESTSEPEGTNEPEPATGTEPIAEATNEPEPTSIPEVEPSVEPEAESTSEPEGETSEPESEFGTTSEPEVTNEPEPTTDTEPTTEATNEPEPTSSPEGEPSVEPESETTISKPEVETTSEPEGTNEPEPATGTEPTAEATNEPEPTSSPEVEPTVEPEAESTSEPEGETSEPESEFGATSEPEVTSEPEPATNTEPTAEATNEPEPTSSPEVEPSVEPEAESTSEPEGETSEPESEFGTTSEPEVTNEPEPATDTEPTAEATNEPEPTSRPEGEPSVEPESEATSEPQGETSEPEVEGTSVPEEEPTSETAEPENHPNAEPNSNSSSEPSAYAEVRPSATEIILPPFALILVILAGLLGLLINSHGYCLKGAYWRKRRKVNDLISFEENIGVDNKFFSSFDREVLECLLSSHNRAGELFKIATPALMSLALCPLTLYLYTPFSTFLWPPEENSSIPNINDAIACFLSPAGLVYATSFGFAFQQALNKQHEILTKMTKEISMIDQMATFTSKLKLKVNSLRLDIYRAIKAEAIFTALQILNREPHSFKEVPPEDVKVRIWSIVDTLRAVETDQTNHINRILVTSILDHIMALNSICSDRMGILHTRIHPVKWAFLETLGFSSFMGVLLLRAYSYRMELVMCIVTVFSISLLCYVVSDLDSPFSGFFRVDLSIIIDVLQRVDQMHSKSLEEDDSDRLQKFRSKLFRVTHYS